MLDNDVAYIVENDVLLYAINTELSKTNNHNLNIQYGSKVASYKLPHGEDPNQNSVVEMNNGDVYTCQLLVSIFCT